MPRMTKEMAEARKEALLMRMRVLCSNATVYTLWINKPMDALGGRSMLEAIESGDPPWIVADIEAHLERLEFAALDEMRKKGQRDGLDT